MSGKQNNQKREKSKGAFNEGETFTNPAFPNKIYKKINGKNVVIGCKITRQAT